ncbi:DUF6252 family protein [Flavobacterium sp. ENC]|uniref:DUF6252 family protein n=1 Tax=Flavobacterium sp. ENC TaxID=2897330 RepID=UPI001E515D1A|nr:DUF6252 family protein [Flavobacterium sp. ENC]MCD0464125.1 DUF6252 family protein [Flavobacterium sp. ENC]
MKKCFCFLSLIFLLVTSCTEDVKFNNPAFQSLKDNVFWRAQIYEAQIAPDDKVTIKGTMGSEQVQLNLPSSEERTYFLGSDNVTRASYYYEIGSDVFLFSTGPNIGEGEITITEYNLENKTISGTFKFKAVNSNAAENEKKNISFTEGVFYKVPVTPGTSFEN